MCIHSRSGPTYWGALAISVFLLPCETGAAFAQLDPEVNKPYRLQVVVHIAKDADLTKIFQDTVRNSLRDSLQGALGELATVEVVTTHPLLDAIKTQGLQAALGGWKSVTGVTTQFVLIDYNRGQYKIQTMQHDGFTGLPSPVLRQTETTDRLIVARAAALLIDQDLGVAGTMEPKPAGDEVNITLKGGALGVPMNRWLNKNDVLAVARLHRVGQELRSDRVDALLQVLEGPDAKGLCRCKLVNRRKELPPAVAFRCVKLGTSSKTRLTLRLVDATTGRPLPSRPVTIAQEGFDVKNPKPYVSDSEGFIHTEEDYSHLAYVRVLAGLLATAKVPVEVMEGQTVVIPLNPNNKDDMLGEIDLHRTRLEGELNETIEVFGRTVSELNETKDPAEALKKAQLEAQNLREEINNRTRELGELGNRIKRERLDKDISLKSQQSRLDVLKKHQGDLDAFINELADAVKKASDPKQSKLAALRTEALQLQSAGEFDQAIKAWRDLAAQAAELAPALKKEAEERAGSLEAIWTIKNEEHKKAREFVYAKWPQAKTPSDLKAGLAEARQAFDRCRKENDYLTVQKLALVCFAHANALKKSLDALNKNNPDDVQQLEIGGKVAEELGKLITEVSDYLTKVARS